ncbi:DUF5819 family protein [Streptomyces europaeiscabiei]|uniref:DUF5819 family protein n=1 Tax=Streptomyces europaeiscabiei TaxID=146819 RepID=UPI0029BD58E3|nr:DUF5819 family protein [Streptomyces europaeiscabiei]MDX3694237.1 DUF5819 family protein [Streptomyces europaeiscabiei]
MVLLVGAALLGAHFSVAAFSQTPLSPAKVQMAPFLSAYLQPYFAQNWMLFAPDPVMVDQGIIARGRCGDGKVTKYYDVTAPSIQRVQGSRFFPSRMTRVVSNGIQQYNSTDDLLMRLREQKATEETKKPGKNPIPLMPHEKRTRDQAVNYLSRYALTQMAQSCGDGRGLQAVQVRMYARSLPPWSQRKNPAAHDKVDAYDLPWKKAADLQ